jgi:ATP-dependent Clp protease ATP-binding subunit ClpC
MPRQGRLDQRGEQVLALALDEARQLRHDWLGTEHLLLGIIRQRDGIAGSILEEFGLELEPVRDALRAIAGEGAESTEGIALTPRMERVIGIAEGFALGQGANVSSEHLLLGLLEEGEGLSADLLRRRGVDLEQLRSRVRSSMPLPDAGQPSR